MEYLNDAAILNDVLGLGYDMPAVTESGKEIEMHRAMLAEATVNPAKKQSFDEALAALKNANAADKNVFINSQDWNERTRKAMSNKIITSYFYASGSTKHNGTYAVPFYQGRKLPNAGKIPYSAPENRIDDIEQYIDYLIDLGVPVCYNMYHSKEEEPFDFQHIVNDYLNGKLFDTTPYQKDQSVQNPPVVQQPVDEHKMKAHMPKSQDYREVVVEVVDRDGEVIKTEKAESAPAPVKPMSVDQQIAIYEEQLQKLKDQKAWEQQVAAAEKKAKVGNKPKQEAPKAKSDKATKPQATETPKIEQQAEVKEEKPVEAKKPEQVKPEKVDKAGSNINYNQQQIALQQAQTAVQPPQQPKPSVGFDPSRFINQQSNEPMAHYNPMSRQVYQVNQQPVVQQVPLQQPVVVLNAQPQVQQQYPVPQVQQIQQAQPIPDVPPMVDPMPGLDINKKVVELRKHIKFIDGNHPNMKLEQIDSLLTLVKYNKLLKQRCSEYKSTCRPNAIFMQEVQLSDKEKQDGYDFAFMIKCKDKKHPIRVTFQSEPFFNTLSGTWNNNLKIEKITN